MNLFLDIICKSKGEAGSLTLRLTKLDILKSMEYKELSKHLEVFVTCHSEACR